MTKTITDTTTSYALDTVRRFTHADNPSAFLATNTGTSHFTVPGTDGLIAYRRAGRYLVQLGGPFAPPAGAADLLGAFREFARKQGTSVVGVQLQRADADLYARHGFTVNQVGASYAVDLNRFTLRGTRFVRLRNKITRAHRAGLTVLEADHATWAEAIRELDRVWLGSKGEHTKELEFLVGQCGGPLQDRRRLFVGLIDDRLVGYISYSPVYGGRAGWMHDLSRRDPGRLPGIMEAINHAAISRFQAEGIAWLHFGFTPFTALDESLEVPGYDLAFRQLMLLLWQYGEAVYPARTQLAYKQKWTQHLVLPEYVAFDGPADIAAFAHIFRAAGAL